LGKSRDVVMKLLFWILVAAAILTPIALLLGWR
jgi:hypothetical protein